MQVLDKVIKLFVEKIPFFLVYQECIRPISFTSYIFKVQYMVTRTKPFLFKGIDNTFGFIKIVLRVKNNCGKRKEWIRIILTRQFRIARLIDKRNFHIGYRNNEFVFNSSAYKWINNCELIT